MIDRRMFLVVVLALALVLFSGSAWAAFRYHRTWRSDQELAQPGWCCNADTRSCGVSQGSDACSAEGGTTFSWEKDACMTICGQSKPKRSPRARPAPAASAAAGVAL